MTTDIDSPIADTPALQPARWQAVAFICGRCEDRKGAPKLDAKRVGKRLREGFRDARLRSRVMSTGCMGLCPKGAVVAAIGLQGEALFVAELRKKSDVAAVVDQMTRGSAATPDAAPSSPTSRFEE